MALYSGLSPTDALQKWYANQNNQNRTPEEQADYLGNMSGLAQQNPAAWKLMQTGQNNNGKTRQIFNPNTGNWDNQQVKSMWSHPETWMQLGFGGALGGIGAAGMMAGAANPAAYVGSDVASTAAASSPATAAASGGIGLGTKQLAQAGANAASTKAQGGSWMDSLKSGAGSVIKNPYAMAGIGAGLGYLGGRASGGGNDVGQLNYGGTSQSNGIGPSQVGRMLNMGQRDAIANQPFRSGATVQPLANSPEGTSAYQLPPIYDSRNGGGQRRFKPQPAPVKSE